MKERLETALALGVVFLLASCGGETAGTAEAEADRPLELSEADQLLRGAHFATALARRDLTGRLRKQNLSLAVGLHQRGKDLQVTYRNPEEGGPVRIHSRFEDGGYEIFELVGGEAWSCSPGRLKQSVGGTDFTHEDLMMPWLWWTGGEIVGEERVKGQRAWKLRVDNPEAGGQYRQVEAWVHQEHGVLMKAVGYDGQGRAIKRFNVLDVQRVGEGMYLFRRGRLDRLDPETNRVVGLSYIEFDGPELVGAAE